MITLAGQFKQLSHEPEKFRWLNGIRIPLSHLQVRGSYLHLISNTALHITFLSYDIPFTGKTWAQQIDLLLRCDLVAQLVRALHQRSWVQIPLSHLNFSRSRDNCLNCPASARIISSFDFKHRTSRNISLIIIIWQALRAGSMRRILCSDWLPERARWSDTTRRRLPVSFPQIKLSQSSSRCTRVFFRRNYFLLR